MDGKLCSQAERVTDWDSWYAARIASQWDSLPWFTIRYRGKRGDDGKYHAHPVAEISLLLEDAEMLCNGHPLAPDLASKIKDGIRKWRKEKNR